MSEQVDGQSLCYRVQERLEARVIGISSWNGLVLYHIYIHTYIHTYIDTYIYMFPDKSSLARFPQLSILLHCLRFDRLRPGLAEGGQRYVAVTVLTQNQFLKNSLSDRCSLVSIFMDQYSEE